MPAITMRLGLIGLLLLIAPVAPAAATSWEVVPQESRVLFDFVRNDASDSGRFTRFAGEGTLDPAHPESATLEMRIESASIDVHDVVVSNFATTEEYFDSAQYPQVIYKLLNLTPEGGNQYEAEGELTIRRFTQPIRTPISLEITGDTARVTGVLRFARKDFHFGVGPSSIFVDLGPEVSVRFTLIAHRVR